MSLSKAKERFACVRWLRCKKESASIKPGMNKLTPWLTIRIGYIILLAYPEDMDFANISTWRHFSSLIDFPFFGSRKLVWTDTSWDVWKVDLFEKAVYVAGKQWRCDQLKNLFFFKCNTPHLRSTRKCSPFWTNNSNTILPKCLFTFLKKCSTFRFQFSSTVAGKTRWQMVVRGDAKW